MCNLKIYREFVSIYRELCFQQFLSDLLVVPYWNAGFLECQRGVKRAGEILLMASLMHRLCVESLTSK